MLSSRCAVAGTLCVPGVHGVPSGRHVRQPSQRESAHGTLAQAARSDSLTTYTLTVVSVSKNVIRSPVSIKPLPCQPIKALASAGSHARPYMDSEQREAEPQLVLAMAQQRQHEHDLNSGARCLARFRSSITTDSLRSPPPLPTPVSSPFPCRNAAMAARCSSLFTIEVCVFREFLG